MIKTTALLLVYMALVLYNELHNYTVQNPEALYYMN